MPSPTDLVVAACLLLGTFLMVVTGVGFLIHVYSVGYMSHEGGYYRYFAFLNLFMAMMLVLVLGSSFAVMFVGWEGVGLCSYLLIGFDFEKGFAADAGKKAFLVNRVGESGIGVIESVYPESTEPSRPEKPSGSSLSPDRTVTHAGTSGIVLAVDLAGLAAKARKADGIIEFVPQVGDFVAKEEPLFQLYGGAAGIDDRELQTSVALGTERTLEQDPTFAFRILVDIAIKALSPAINDPTTAVLAIDQIHRLLRLVGQRHLSREEIHDETGRLRLIFRTPNWEDFVHLACTEIRHCGAGSIQIMRRMRSMLETLIHSLPTHRHPELRKQMELLDRAIEGHYVFAEDRALARIADPQGLGGSVGVQPAIEAQNRVRGA